MVSTVLFALGSAIALGFQLIAIYVHHKYDGYTLLRSQLSYTGNRHGFTHHSYGRYFPPAHNPFWFNTAYILGGLTLLAAFLTVLSVDSIISLSGIGFCISVITVGIFDVGTDYRKHEKGILASQFFFLIILVTTFIKYYSTWLLTFTTVLLFFVGWYVYTKVTNIREYNPDKITISQRISVFLEILFLAWLPFLIS